MDTNDGQKQPIEIARELVLLLGGKENIAKVTHCTTRLRFELHDDRRVKSAELEALPYVHGTFSRLGLFQIIIGSVAINN
ncbi:MAG: PTS glucose/sucrose transporter subunit IIB, partial [Bacillus sp. (in: firmicutes)]